MGHEILKKFGRYFLLDAIAQGGMAEIYRACLAEKDGSGRLLVIKLIQNGADKNQEFLAMFRSEIKVTMGFNHPNIVQLFDYGEEKGHPFIAMELIDGRNLRQVLMRFLERKEPFPIEFAVYCAEQAAAGLAYAHGYKDKITGEPFNLVHRDISPQNVLVSFDGNVKLIDFGIAKATTNQEATRAGVIKGKLSYLSPEQITGEELDGRSDLFALGIVLWELLTGRKLFHAPGDNEFAILKLIESCQNHVKRPSTLNPQVPKELDHIVLKALAKDRTQRFQSADDFQRALRKFLISYTPDFSPGDFSPTIKALFQDEIVEDRKLLQKLTSQVERLVSDETEVNLVLTEGFESSAGVSDTTTFFGQKPSPEPVAPPVTVAPRMDLNKNAFQNAESLEVIATPGVEIKTKSGIRNPRFGASGGTSSYPGGRTRTRTSITRLPPQQARVPAAFLDSAVKLGFLFISTVIGSAYFAPQLGWNVPILSSLLGTEIVKNQNAVIDVNPVNPVAANPTAVPQQRVDAKKQIQVFVNITPPLQLNGEEGAKVVLNGRPLDLRTLRTSVAMDEPLELVVERAKFHAVRREFTISSSRAQGLSEYSVDVSMEAVRYGFLTLHTTPSAEALLRPVDSSSRALASADKPWVLRTPVENERIPAGTYNILLRNELLGVQKTLTVTVQEGKVLKLNETFEIRD